MPTFTICPLYISDACQNPDDYINILIKFCQDNNFKVGFDDSDYIITQYRNLLGNDENFRNWLNFLLFKKSNYEIIKITNTQYNSFHSAVIETCSNSYDKILSCKEKNDYIQNKQDIDNKSITLLDADEFRNMIRYNATFVANQYNQTSYGDNSGNTITKTQ